MGWDGTGWDVNTQAEAQLPSWWASVHLTSWANGMGSLLLQLLLHRGSLEALMDHRVLFALRWQEKKRMCLLDDLGDKSRWNKQAVRGHQTVICKLAVTEGQWRRGFRESHQDHTHVNVEMGVQPIFLELSFSQDFVVVCSDREFFYAY